MTQIERREEKKIERRGGARVNAGRKPGTKNYVKRLVAIRTVTEDIIRQGKLPLRTMIKYMTHYDEEVDNLEQPFADALAQNGQRFSEEGFLRAMELYAKIGDLRMKAGHFAQMAAPYLHARLSHQSLDVTHKVDPRSLAPDATSERRREEFRRLRSSPYSPTVTSASDEYGEPVEAEILEPEDEDA